MASLLMPLAWVGRGRGWRGARRLSCQSSHVRFRRLQPVRHLHLVVHRRRGGETRTRPGPASLPRFQVQKRDRAVAVVHDPLMRQRDPEAPGRSHPPLLRPIRPDDATVLPRLERRTVYRQRRVPCPSVQRLVSFYAGLFNATCPSAKASLATAPPRSSITTAHAPRPHHQSASFQNPIRPDQQRRRDREAERSSC